MIETIAVFAAKTIASYAVQKKLDHLFTDKKKFEKKLSKVIDASIKEFKAGNPIPGEGEKFAFYDSRIIMDELLKFRFFSNKGYKLDEAEISLELRKNPNIIQPQEEQLISFLNIFEQNINKDGELKKLEIDESYKSEIFNISNKIDNLGKEILDELAKLIEPQKEIPKELTAINPVRQKDIVGREKDLKNLRESLIQENDTALINGMGGIGKTTLAAVYVSKFYNEYDHIVWLTLENTLSEAIAANYSLLVNLKLKETPPEEQLNACLNELRTLKSEKPKLLVLDNANDSLAGHYAKLPKAPGWHLLVTSRERIAHFRIIDLDFLKEDEAVELFKKYNRGFSDQQVLGIVKKVELHTLAIEILAKSSHKNRWDLSEVENALTVDAKADIKIKHAEKKIERIKTYLTGIFDTSKIDTKETYILKQFTALPNLWITYNFLSELLQKDKLEWKKDFAGAIENVYEKGFILKDEDNGSYKMHPVLVEALTPRLKAAVEDLKLLTDSVSQLLKIDQTKDNPIDKFQYIPFAEAILKHIPDDSSADTSLLKNNLANVYSELGDYEKARDLLEPALKSALENFGEKHPSVAISQSNLANVYSALGDYEKARDLDELALKSNLENFGEKHPNVTVSQSNLANVYSALGDYEKARDLDELALKSNLENFGEKHPNVAVSQSNLANVYSALGDYEKARDLLEPALKSGLENFGEKHPSVATRQSNLANVYSALGDYEKARDLLEPALKSALENFGEKHPNVAVSQSNLALVYKALGDYEKARDLLEPALKSALENFGEKHPNVAISQSNLALVYSALGDYEKARDLLEPALKSALENFGEKHPNVAISQSNLALVYSALGDYEKARDLLEPALKSDLENFGEKHPSVAVSQSNLALVYKALGDYEKARDLWINAYDIFVTALGEQHPNTKTVKEFLVRINSKRA